MRFNHYEYNPETDSLGEGAFAEVFKATDTKSGKQVALKIYKEPLTSGSTSNPNSGNKKKYSLEREFETAQDLSHTNIIRYKSLDYFESTDSFGRKSFYPTVVLEFASEGSLNNINVQSWHWEGKLKLIRDIVEGVAYLHRQGVIHRDLKPANILLAKDKKGDYVAKITDFGVSIDTITGKTIEQSYTAGVGTPHYMAPEQFYKKRFGLNENLSNRTDLWAVGIIIHYIFTGTMPFASESGLFEEIRESITEHEYQTSSSCPDEITKIIKKCLVKHAKTAMQKQKTS